MGRLGRVAIVGVVLLGCGPRIEPGGGDAGQSAGTGESITGSGPTASGVGTTRGDDSQSPTTDEGTGDFTEATGATVTGDTTESSTDSAGSGGGAWESICSLHDVDPRADSPMEAGDEPGMIPIPVGAAIENNCGCHLAAETSDPQMYILNAFPLRTWQVIQGQHSNGQPRHEVAYRRVTHGTIPMPPPPCDHEDQRIAPDDKALLTDWLGQGAPDGATYVPP